MKFLLLYNPVSGRSQFKRHIPYIVEQFSKSNHTLEIYESKAPKDLMRVAEIEAKHHDVFLVAGGDGTINEVLNGVMKSEIKPAIALLPSGTANDIASILGMNKRIKRTLKIIFNQEPVLIDVNQLNELYFLYTAASGMMSRISYDISRYKVLRYGYLAYVIEAMKDFVNDYRYPIHIKTNGQTIDCECMMVLGLSTNRVGGVSLHNFSKSKLNDGKFELRFFKRARLFRRVRLMSSFMLGGLKLREDLHLESSYFDIKTSKDVRWNIDGEYACNGNVIIQTHKEAIKIYVSAKRKKKFF